MSTFILERASGAGVPDGFTDLPALVYRDHPQWIPERPADVLAAFGADNPWFVRGAAHTFCIPGVARAAVFAPPGLVIDGKSAAFFGYWCSVGDVAAERAIFDRIETWAHARGAQAIYGPIDFNTFGQNRFRLEAEPAATTFVGEPYNLDAAEASMTQLGFAPCASYVSQVFGMSGLLSVSDLISSGAERARDAGYQVQVLDHASWVATLERMYPLVDSVFSDNFAYTPISKEAFVRAFGARFIRRACPHGSVLALGPGGDVVGFFLAYPDYGPLVIQGSTEPKVRVTELDYERHAHLVAGGAVVMKTVGVAPEHRRAGVMELMVVEMTKRLSPRYSGVIGAMIRSDNPSRRLAAKIQPTERRYALFAKSIGAKGSE